MFQKVEGPKKDHKIKCFTLSTCVWCKRTKAWLTENGYEFEYCDVDLKEGQEKQQVRQEMEKYSQRISYPIVIINEKDVIIGHHIEKLQEALKA